MAELTTQERLQPSLLDRLTDRARDALQEGRDERVMSAQRLRESVLRDIGWLLNAIHLEACEDLSDFPEVAASTVNYGIPDLSGMIVQGADLPALQLAIRDAIARFEPRISAGTLHVELEAQPDQMSRRTLSFRIEGEMWAQPMPLALYLKTEVDLENAQFRVAEQGG
ncbi:MAG: type VI secretion system baseplate subunit TssE [Solimonas sp.]